MAKMEPMLNSKLAVTRFYNYIAFDGDRVIKGAPRERFVKEIAWFKEAKKIIPDNIPHIYHYDKHLMGLSDAGNLKYYEMEAIDGENLYQWTLDNKNLTPKAFNQLVKLVKKMHRMSYQIKEKEKNEDIFQMYFLKPKKGLEDFTNNKQIDLNSLVINNQKVRNPRILLEDIFKSLQKSLTNTRYSFIHGDLTMSNILIDRKKKLFLIDPRGAFGKTSVYGDVRYDVAKLYYSIIGNYDSLNNGQFTYSQDRSMPNKYAFSIFDCGFKSYARKMLDEFKEKLEIIQFIHATIWLSLIPHVANNLNQQFCTFCNGVYLLNSLGKNG